MLSGRPSGGRLCRRADVATRELSQAHRIESSRVHVCLQAGAARRARNGEGTTATRLLFRHPRHGNAATTASNACLSAFIAAAVCCMLRLQTVLRCRGTRAVRCSAVQEAAQPVVVGKIATIRSSRSGIVCVPALRMRVRAALF